MDANKILHEFTHSDELPRAAIQAASERRNEMVPIFLGEIEKYLALDSDQRAKPTPFFFIFHLLGEWKEVSAYRPLIHLLRLPQDEIDALFGDGITPSSHRVMAAVFDGDPQPLQDLILDLDAEDFIRARMCDTLAMVVLQGKLDQRNAGIFLRDCITNLRPHDECYVWCGWQNAISMLGMSDLKILVKRAFDRGFINPTWIGFDDFERALKRALENPEHPWHYNTNEYTLFGDTIEELSTWYCFTDEYKKAQAKHQAAAEGISFHEPHINPLKEVGRNDPCPCGSGKKYKKCCLD